MDILYINLYTNKERSKYLSCTFYKENEYITVYESDLFSCLNKTYNNIVEATRNERMSVNKDSLYIIMDNNKFIKYKDIYNFIF